MAKLALDLQPDDLSLARWRVLVDADSLEETENFARTVDVAVHLADPVGVLCGRVRHGVAAAHDRHHANLMAALADAASLFDSRAVREHGVGITHRRLGAFFGSAQLAPVADRFLG